MTNLTKKTLKAVAHNAMVKNGIKAYKKDIVLLEASGDGSYILWEVKGKQYAINDWYKFQEVDC